MSLEKLLVNHMRIIIFDPKENETEIIASSTEYFHFILNCSSHFSLLMSSLLNIAFLRYSSYKWNEFDHIHL